MIFTNFMDITTIFDKILGKELKPSKIVQDRITLISVFLYLLTTFAKNSKKESVKTLSSLNQNTGFLKFN